MSNDKLTVGDVFPGWMRAADLPEAGLVLTVDRVQVRPVPTFGYYPLRPVVTFAEDRRAMVASVTQARAFASAAGSEVFADWVGLRVVLRAGRARNGRPTIEVVPVGGG